MKLRIFFVLMLMAIFFILQWSEVESFPAHVQHRDPTDGQDWDPTHEQDGDPTHELDGDPTHELDGGPTLEQHGDHKNSK